MTSRHRLLTAASVTPFVSSLLAIGLAFLVGGVFLEALKPLAASLLGTVEKLQLVERGYVDPVRLRARLERLLFSEVAARYYAEMFTGLG